MSSYDIASDGKRVAALIPAEDPDAQNAQNHVIFLLNFFDELRRRGQRFSLQYPANWQAYGGSNSDSLTIAPPNGIVQGGNQNAAVGYGAIVSYFFPDNQRSEDLVSATDDLIHHLIAQNHGMQVSGNSRRTRVANHDALITPLQSGSPYGGAETDALLTVATDQGLFYMIFIAPQEQFGRIQSTFDQMVQSIRFS